MQACSGDMDPVDFLCDEISVRNVCSGVEKDLEVRDLPKIEVALGLTQRIVVTGADGFIAKHLQMHLQQCGYSNVLGVGHQTDRDALMEALHSADFVFHLAGVNRPLRVEEFEVGNVQLTRALCNDLIATGHAVPVVFTSSVQAVLDNAYGRSKLEAEAVLENYKQLTGAPVAILRLPNVFGKWCKPNYNSAVATFCFNKARGLPITINNPFAPLNLVHVDDVVAAMVDLLKLGKSPWDGNTIRNVYSTTVGDVASIITGFASSMSSQHEHGLSRALYSTYLSYLLP